MAVYLQERVCNVLGYTTFNVNKTLQLFVFHCLIIFTVSLYRSIHTGTPVHTHIHTHDIVNNALGNSNSVTHHP